LGDIGQHFPDSDARFSGIDSRVLLRHVAKLMQQNGYQLSNLDVTIAAQAPKLAGHLQQMRQNIASDCNAESGAINVKATTTEKLGFVGRQEGVEAHAVVLLNIINR